MKHNASPEKNMNSNAKGLSDFDNGKTTNKGTKTKILNFNNQEKTFQTLKNWMIRKKLMKNLRQADLKHFH